MTSPKPARQPTSWHWQLLFWCYVLASALHIGWVMHHEPFAFDAWNMAVDTNSEPITTTRFWAYIVDQYTGSNPRFGQIPTYLGYKLVWFAPLATPLAFFALVSAIVTLGTRRLPRLTVGRDLALLAMALGFSWMAMPQVGKILFCRAYSANYIYAAAIQLWFCVPLVLVARSKREVGLLAAVPYAALGFIAGMCNEHTGPTILLATATLIWWLHRQRAPLRLHVAGFVGYAAGFAALFFAPGQDQRYDGLATKVSLVGRLLQRGLVGNWDIMRGYFTAVLPSLLLLALVLVVLARRYLRDLEITTAAERREVITAMSSRMWFVGIALGLGVLVTATVFVSPKLGPRFYLHTAALMLGAVIGVADVVLNRRRQWAPFVAIAVLASGYAALRTVPLYSKLAHDSAQRLATLDRAPAGSLATVEAYSQTEDSWWFLGDDFRDRNKQAMISKFYNLRGVVLRAPDPYAMLGVSDVRLVPRATFAPRNTCFDDIGGFQVDGYRGIDIGSVQNAIGRSLDNTAARLAAIRGAPLLERVDIAVGFVGDPPVLPRDTLLVASWDRGKLTAHAGSLGRKSVGKTRDVVVPPSLRAAAAGQPPSKYDIYIYAVGDQAKLLGQLDQAAATTPRLTYVPWRTATYWALACDSASCLVFAAARHRF